MNQYPHFENDFSLFSPPIVVTHAKSIHVYNLGGFLFDHLLALLSLVGSRVISDLQPTKRRCFIGRLCSAKYKAVFEQSFYTELGIVWVMFILH